MSTNERRYDIDWLRVLAMLSIFFFHCARFFDNDFWHVKNNRLDFGMSVFVGVVGQWIMPLFFVLSAISAYHALTRRTNGQYMGERFQRLVVPLLGGILVLIPPQVYIERVTHSQFVGSFVTFLPHYFDGLYGFGGNFAWMGLHLWYLEALFVFSLLTLPLFRYLRKDAAQGLVSKAAVLFKAPGAILLFAVPVAIAELIANLQPEGIGRRDFGGWSLLAYLVFFVVGYWVGSNQQFKQSIEEQRIVALTVAVVTTVAGFFWLTSGYSSRTCLFSFLRALNSWSWLVAILGFGSRYLSFGNERLKYANEAVLPFYILHQTVIVVVGFYIASWDVSVIVKYLILSSASFLVIVGLYELLIKRVQVLRFIFGMKPRTGSTERVSAGA